MEKFKDAFMKDIDLCENDKIYIIRQRINDDGSLNTLRRNYGYSSHELLGKLEEIQLDILYQTKNIGNIEIIASTGIDSYILTI